tara:strand:+ start:5648 stop:5887 length:240 start_codon:yes stop_codon:yes gene_type:complete
MTVTVGTLRPAFGQGEELIAHIEEGHTLAPAPEIETEDRTIEAERFVDVSDLQRDVVDAYEPGAPIIGHATPTPVLRGR